jgi:hypothetical protein
MAQKIVVDEVCGRRYPCAVNHGCKELTSPPTVALAPAIAAAETVAEVEVGSAGSKAESSLTSGGRDAQMA